MSCKKLETVIAGRSCNFYINTQQQNGGGGEKRAVTFGDEGSDRSSLSTSARQRGGGESKSTEEEEVSRRDDDYDITYNAQHSRYECKVMYHPTVFGIIIGSKGATIQRIMDETAATVVVPRNVNRGFHPVFIHAKREHACVRAADEIALLVAENAGTGRNSHFVNIPLNLGSVMDTHTAWMADFKENCAAQMRGYDDSLLQWGAKLHFTLTMVRLSSPEQAARAAMVLDAVVGTVTDPLYITLQGLHVFSDTQPSNAQVLFWGAAESKEFDPVRRLSGHVLQALFAEGLLEDDWQLKRSFTKKGLQKVYDHKKQRRVGKAAITDCSLTAGEVTIEYHATVLNASYRRREAGKKWKRVGFDCTAPLRMYSDKPTCTVVAPSIALSEVGTEDPKTKFYQTLHTTPLPQPTGR